MQNLAMPERKKEILEEDVYQPVIQEAKGLHFAPANWALQKYSPPDVGKAEQICNNNTLYRMHVEC